ncbi:hypothetical protein [Corynebacterium pacaense]|uniref:hypothetical protein n=1 Tax=Corynebacterium pacaense TaxID=1816684 RepID=UPI0009BA1DCF|nr:hypothetical protein [Corynebacterium pacaense]
MSEREKVVEELRKFFPLEAEIVGYLDDPTLAYSGAVAMSCGEEADGSMQILESMRNQTTPIPAELYARMVEYYTDVEYWADFELERNKSFLERIPVERAGSQGPFESAQPIG